MAAAEMGNFVRWIAPGRFGTAAGPVVLAALLGLAMTPLPAAGQSAPQAADKKPKSEPAEQMPTPDAAAQTLAPEPVEQSATLLEQCWTPKQLAGKANEIRPRRGGRIKPPKSEAGAPKPEAIASGGAVRRVKLPEGKKLVALTFDLCELGYEIAGYDGRIVDYLRKNDVKATFFAGGKWLLTHPERAQQLAVDPNFEIASHGWRHRNLQVLSGDQLTREIMDAQLAYRKMRTELAARACLIPKPSLAAGIPQRITLFRFPYGTCAPKALKAVADAGLLAIQWDVATGDPAPQQSARRIAANVLRNVKPGSIVLGHANGRGWNTSKALPLFIPKLKEQGYEFVTVSELLAAGEPVLVQKCYDQRPGDTERWARGSTKGQKRRKRRAKRVWNPFQQ